MTPKARLLNVLCRQAVDRPPVICTGGMMNAAIIEIMNSKGHTLPEAHINSNNMAQLAADIHQFTGFENIGIPFCMTVEAEILGSAVSYGTLSCEPKVIQERFRELAEVVPEDITHILTQGRVQVVLDAIREVSTAYPEIPVVGNICGPVSLAASLVDPMAMLKGLRRDKASAHRVFDYVSALLGRLACLMVENGASVISIGDPTATGEILGPELFEEYAVHYINQIIEAVHASETKVIVHICGNMNRVRQLLPAIHADAVSVDALIDLRKLKDDFPQMTVMGNVSTYLLQKGPADKIRVTAQRLVEQGVDIISPACGLSTSTSIEMIQAMTKAVNNNE